MKKYLLILALFCSSVFGQPWMIQPTTGSGGGSIAGTATAVPNGTVSVVPKFDASGTNLVNSPITVSALTNITVTGGVLANYLTAIGTVTAASLVGPLTGNVTGNASGSAATVTSAAQPAITSVGTLTSLATGAITGSGEISTTLTTEQFKLSYDGSDSISWTVMSDASTTLQGVGSNAGFNRLYVNSASGQPRWQFINSDTGTTVNDGFHVGLDSDESVYLRNKENTSMHFYNNNVEKMTLTATGIFLIGNTTNDPGDIDPAMVIRRNLNGSGTAHSYVDSSAVDRTGNIGHNSYDDRTTFTGVNNVDHHAGFQFRSTWNDSGTADRFVGFQSQPIIQSGTITHATGFEVKDLVQTGGTVTDQVAFKVWSLTNGVTHCALLVGDSDVNQNILRVGVTGLPQINWNQAVGQLEFTSTAGTNSVKIGSGLGIGVNAPATGLSLNTAYPISIKSGTNQRAGNATMVGGTIAVANTTVTANTIVIPIRKTSGGTIGFGITYTTSAGVGFTLNSDNVLDTSTFSYMLIEVP